MDFKCVCLHPSYIKHKIQTVAKGSNKISIGMKKKENEERKQQKVKNGLKGHLAK